MLELTRPADRSGLSRRTLLSAGGAGLCGVTLNHLLAAESQTSAKPKAKSVIFLFLFGGPSQLETFDMKPEAPDNIRGPFKTTPCKTPGLLVCDQLPRLASVSDKFTIVRTMSHTFNDHSGGGHYLQTGKRWHIPIGGGFNATPQDWPSIAAVNEYLAQQSPAGLQRELPTSMCVPNRLGRIEQQGQYLRPGQYGGWLGRAYDPLCTTVDRKNEKDNPYWRDCTDEELTFPIAGLQPNVTLDVMHSRHSLLAQLQEERRRLEYLPERTFSRHRQRALSLVSSEKTRAALDIKQERPELRDQYGRHLFGQSCLMARRLVEAGVRVVTVFYDAVDGYSWDSHQSSTDVKNHLLPSYDQAASALLTDLDERGMLDETMVIALGEMGRTPRANANWGRDHWSTLFPALIAGGGIRRGAVIGKSDRIGGYALDTPYSPEDLAATIYWALGIDPDMMLPDAQGRPHRITEGGRPQVDWFG